MGEMCCTLYNHVAPPNQTTCAATRFPGNMANMAMQVPPSSNHPGGVNVLMGDASGGSSRTASTCRHGGISGTRNGGEVISPMPIDRTKELISMQLLETISSAETRGRVAARLHRHRLRRKPRAVYADLRRGPILARSGPDRLARRQALRSIAATPPIQVGDSAWQAGQQVESFEIGEEEDDGDGTKQFAVKLKMKKPPGDQSVRYFVHGRDPVWVYREEDYKRMINMDNNPVTNSPVRSPVLGDRRGDDDRHCTRFRTAGPEHVPGDRADLAPGWFRAQAGPGPAADPDRARGRGAGRRPVGGDSQLLGPVDAGHPFREYRIARRLGRYRVFLPDGPGRGLRLAGRCGICNMALVRRKRGEAVALPDGVVARMQLSPYRIQLAGIQTAPATFRPLVREFESSGVVTRDGEGATVLARNTRAAGTLDRRGPDRWTSLARPPGSRHIRRPGS